MSLSHAANLAALQTSARQMRMVTKVRPTVLASPLLSLLARRKIVEVEGMRLFLDPTTHLGQTVLSSGSYEPETTRQFRAYVKPGATVLDIGANEGFFAAMAAQIVGPKGLVIAVEPQTRLHDVLEINLALNDRANTRIIPNIVAEQDDLSVAIHLYPISNTGASSVVEGHRLSARTEIVKTITPATILRDCGVERADFVKIDVEGFEPEVVRALVPLLDRGAIEMVLLDYHTAVLKRRGIDAEPTHAAVIARGMRPIEGTVGHGYVLYARG